MTEKTDAECRSAIKEFALIASCDEGYAFEILQEFDFNVEPALQKHFEDKELNDVIKHIEDEDKAELSASLNSSSDTLKKEIKEEDSTKSDTSDVAADKPTTSGSETSNKSLKRPAKVEFEDEPQPSKQSRISEHFASTKVKSENLPSTSTGAVNNFFTDLPDQLTVMSYNIDGLDDRVRDTRFLAVLNVVARLNPEVIFFQEFIASYEPKLNQVLGKMYHIFTGYVGCDYYTVTCVSKNIKIERNEIVNFDHSMMGRNMLCVEAKWKELSIKLINSHLESCWDQATTRKRQFIDAMEKMKTYNLSDPKTLAIFAGDLNIRDPEVSNVPTGVVDAWIATGSNNEFKYTWDTKLNDNKETRKPVRNRFDRFYVKNGAYSKMDFFLDGKQRIKNCNLFPSDHFAIVCKFSQPKSV